MQFKMYETVGYTASTTSYTINSGLCFTFFTVALAGLLILALIALAKWVTIEKHLKNQFRSPTQDFYSLSSNRDIVPTFSKQEEIGKDLAQMYYYHDCCYRNDFCGLPGTVVDKIQYTKNRNRDTPIVTIFKEGGVLYAVFRSTKTRIEMKKDTDMSQTHETHDGFRSIFNDVSTKFIASLKEHSRGCDKIVLFGHSLGGALVDLASDMMIHRYPRLWDKTFAISSGSPRVYTPDRMDEYSRLERINRYMKIVNEADMVNFLPVTVTVNGSLFRHGKKYFYKSFSNQSRIFRFNKVIQTQLMDSHISKTYADEVWETDGDMFPVIPFVKNV